MDWSSWKSWALVGGALIALFAIYTFASPDGMLRDDQIRGRVSSPASPALPAVAVTSEDISGNDEVEQIKMARLEPDPGTFKSTRNVFSFVEPPPPPPPAPPRPVVPKDSDKDGVPDFQDNCVAKANPEQTDIDENGQGDACQEGIIERRPPPPPPEPQPPSFNYKLLGTFGTANNPIAAFSAEGEIVNVRVGQTFGGGKFILSSIGIESAEIGFVGFPPHKVKRVPIGDK